MCYCFLCGAWSVQLQSHLTVLMEDPQLTNIESARRMVWRLKCSERWSNVRSTFCPSVLIELLLSMWCLISAVADSSNSVNGRSSTDQEWMCQMDGVKVEVQWKVIKCMFYIQCKVFTELLLSMWCLISAVAEPSNSVNGRSSTDQQWKCQTDAVKGDQTYVLYSVRMYSLSYCFLCGAWSVQSQIHLIVLMDDTQLTNIERARRMAWRMECGERSTIVHSTFCLSVFIE